MLDSSSFVLVVGLWPLGGEQNNTGILFGWKCCHHSLTFKLFQPSSLCISFFCWTQKMIFWRMMVV